MVARKRGSQEKHDELEDIVKKELESKGYKVKKHTTYSYDYVHSGVTKTHNREIDLEARKYDNGLYFEVKSGRPSRDKAIGQLYHIANFFNRLFGRRQYYLHAYYDDAGKVKYDWIKNLGVGKR